MTSTLINAQSAATAAPKTWISATVQLLRRQPRRAQLGAAALVYLILSCVIFWPVGPFDDSRVVTCGCYDVVAQTWYMTWAPHALLTGANPLFTHAMNVPFGVNLASNTSLPLLGIVTEPITWLFGPFASFNVLIRLAFCLSALSMFFVLRRWVKTPGAAFLGGLFYGFSPYMFAQGRLHLNLTFVAVPPLIVLALDEIIRRRKWSAKKAGLALGLLCIAQYLITAEVLADTVLLTGIIGVLFVLRFPKQTWESRQYLVTTLIWALVPFLVICGYPIIFALKGPEHVSIVSGIIFGNSTFRADLLSPFVPTSDQLLGSAHWKSLADSWVNANPNENDIYLGIPTVALFVASVVFVRHRFVRVMALVAAISFLFALGPRLIVDGSTTNIWLPFSLLLRISVLQIEVPARYSLFTALGVAVVLAMGADRFYLWQHAHWSDSATADFRSTSRLMQLGTLSAVTVLAVGSIATLLPKGPIASEKTNVPTYFTTKAVNQIPKGTNVLTYPYPIIQSNIAMAWQVEANFRFNIIGDYALTPFQTTSPKGGGLGGGLVPPTLDPPFVEELFENALSGPARIVPTPNPAAFATTKSFLDRYKVDTIIVDHVGAQPGLVVAFFTQMFHAAPQRSGSLSIWYHVRSYQINPKPVPRHRARKHHATG